MLTFLDVLVERYPTSFLASVYRTLTFTGLYLSLNTDVPKSRNINRVITYTHRAMVIYSECKLDANLGKLPISFP